MGKACVVLMLSSWLFVQGQSINQRRPVVPGKGGIQSLNLVRSKARPVKPQAEAEPAQASRSEARHRVRETLAESDGSDIFESSQKRQVGGHLTPSEALAATFALLKLPPPFEDATISMPFAQAILLVDPDAYQGRLAPFQGTAVWVQGDGRNRTESVASKGGYLVVRWPGRELGSPQGASLVLHMQRPVIAVQFLWSDFTFYGSDVTKLLLQQVGNWETSPRKLVIHRQGYREALFPGDLKAAIQHPDVAPILEPQLQRAAPQLLQQLKAENTGAMAK